MLLSTDANDANDDNDADNGNRVMTIALKDYVLFLVSLKG